MGVIALLLPRRPGATFENTTILPCGILPLSANDSATVGGAPLHDYATFPRQFVTYRWFKPLLVALLTTVFVLVFQIALIIESTVLSGNLHFIDTVDEGYEDTSVYTLPGALFGLGAVACMLPALALAALIVRDRPYSSYSSSRGGWNWRVFAKCLGVAAIVMGVLTVVEFAFFPDEDVPGENLFTIGGIIACLVLIPLQCVAEEYVFRGFLLQTFASWTKLPVVGIIVSAVIFAAGHPYNDIGVIAVLLNGLIWGFVAWRTRGLEATSALHIVNNLLAFFMAGFGLQANTSQIDIVSLVMAVITDIIFAASVLLIGKRFGWFESSVDGAAAFNEKHAAKRPAQTPASQPQPHDGAQQPAGPDSTQQPAGPDSAQQPASQPQSHDDAQQPTRPDGAPEPPLRYRS